MRQGPSSLYPNVYNLVGKILIESSKRIKFIFPLPLFIFSIHQQNLSKRNHGQPQIQFFFPLSHFTIQKPFPYYNPKSREIKA